MAEDDELDDEMEDEDETEDNESEGSSGSDSWTPPTQEEWERTRAALTKANGEAKKHRLALKNAKKVANDSSAASGAEKARQDAEREAEEKYLPRIKRSAAKSALIGAGLADADKADVVKAAVRLIDLDELDVDEDGDVEGLEEAVAELKRKFPGMFTKTRTKGKVSTGDRGSGSSGSGNGSTGPKKDGRNSARKLAEVLKG